MTFDMNTVKAFTDKAEGLRDKKIEVSTHYIEATEKLLNLSEEDSRHIWAKVAENNRYELVQAVTSRANDIFIKGDDPERATELQKLGGRLVEKPSIWDAIAADAQKKVRK
jgi:hypothetical protein